jgi:hypothetical protein
MNDMRTIEALQGIRKALLDLIDAVTEMTPSEGKEMPNTAVRRIPPFNSTPLKPDFY